jgi:6-phosphogluconolactonase
MSMSRKYWPLMLLAVVALASIAAADPVPPPAAAPRLSPKDTLAYVGTFTKGQAKGIYAFRLDTEDLEVPQNVVLTPLGLAAETPNPAYLEIDPKRRVVFAANDIHEYQGKPSGSVSAFAVDAGTGKLKLLNQQPSGGPAPCHMVMDRQRRNLLVTNCIGGSVAVFPVAADGKLGASTALVQHPGTKPHTHGITLSPDNRYAYACDMGLDRVMAYQFDAAKGKLTPAAVPTIALKAGTGPRHMVFGRDGKFAYVVGSKASTITVFAFDGKAGGLKQVQTVKTVPEWFDGSNTAAELAVHPSANYLYVSNRGHNSVVMFTIDPGKGTLTYLEDQDTGGKTPRHFALDAGAKHLGVGNQESDTVLVCRIDGDRGRLKPSGVSTPVPSPTVVGFLPPK